MRALLSVTNVLGRLLLVFSLTYLVPIASALYYADGTLIDLRREPGGLRRRRCSC